MQGSPLTVILLLGNITGKDYSVLLTKQRGNCLIIFNNNNPLVGHDLK